MSTALLGASSSASVPARVGMLSVDAGADQEPSAATALPASSTPDVALGAGAVRRMMRAVPRPAPRFSVSASGLEPGGSSSTSTTRMEWPGHENDATT